MRNLKQIFAPVGAFFDDLTKVINSETKRPIALGSPNAHEYFYSLRAKPSGVLFLVLENETLLSCPNYSTPDVPAYHPFEDRIHIHNLGPEEAKTLIARFDKGENLNRLLTMVREGKDSRLDYILDIEDKQRKAALKAHAPQP